MCAFFVLEVDVRAALHFELDIKKYTNAKYNGHFGLHANRLKKQEIQVIII
jgi:hypothetical protein